MKPTPRPFSFVKTPQTRVIYSNLQLLTSSPYEITIDVARIDGARVSPDSPMVEVDAQIVMTPLVAKRLLQGLERRIREHEAAFGEIRETDRIRDEGTAEILTLFKKD